MSELKHIVINDVPYLVDEAVFDWHLAMSKDNDLMKGALPCDVIIPGNEITGTDARFRKGVDVSTLLGSIKRRQELIIDAENTSHE